MTAVGGQGFQGSARPAPRHRHRDPLAALRARALERADRHRRCASSSPAWPGTVVRARPSGGNFQLQRILGGGTDARLALEIRGYDLDDARRLSNDAKLLMEQTPGLADVRLAKDDARPELALRVDRDKAALLGLTVNQVATTVRTNIAGTQAAFYRERGREYPIIVRLRPEDRQRVDNVNDVLVATPTGRAGPGQVADAGRQRARPGRDRAQEPRAREPRQRRARRHARRRRRQRQRPPRRSCASRATSPSGSAPRSRSRPRPSRSSAGCCCSR